MKNKPIFWFLFLFLGGFSIIKSDLSANFLQINYIFFRIYKIDKNNSLGNNKLKILKFQKATFQESERVARVVKQISQFHST